MPEKKLNGTVIVTYRCNARCNMCSRFKAPSRPEEKLDALSIYDMTVEVSDGLSEPSRADAYVYETEGAL